MVGRVSLFGAVSFFDDAGVPVALRSVVHRRIVAILAMQTGSEVRFEFLCETLGLKSSALRTSISRLRGHIGDTTIETGAVGYRLTSEVDVSRFEQLVAGPDSTDDRLARVTQALALWVDDPLDEFASEEWAQPFVARLTELRVLAIEHRSQLLIADGRADEAISQLQGHVMANPLSDRGQGLLIEALGRVGRQTEALRAYQTYRDYLAEETGNEPSTAVQEIEQRVATGDTGPRLGSMPTLSQAQPPTGTVTFLFTDIEGSTALWEDQPDEMQVAVEQHDQVIGEAIENASGHVFSTAGDSFAAAFARVADALRAAKAAQDALSSVLWPLSAPISVRMGLHTGEAQERDGDYFGRAVNKAARVMDAGHGGQVLVSSTTAAVHGDTNFHDLGHFYLRGFQTPEQIYQLGSETFPALRVTSHNGLSPLRNVDELAGNLPTQLSSFVGRDRELASLKQAILSQRLTTLIGVGGTGKTRLAVAAASEVEHSFADGVWFFEFGSVADNAGVTDAMLSTLRITPQPGLNDTELLVSYFRDRTALLILDNCEHVLDVCATISESILGGAADARILATSREPLLAEGEQLVAVPSLPIGTAAEPGDAVRLFTERLQDQDGKERTEVERQVLIDICTRLDGIPLAIELAASRCRTMGVDAVRDRLDERFRLLTGGRRTVAERHQTLAATVDWSYDLLTEAEQEIFRRLSVFSGWFGIDDLVGVCSDQSLDEVALVDGLTSLVDKSMCVLAPERAEAPYRLLETLRAYGRNHLASLGQIDSLRLRHAQWYVELCDDVTENFASAAEQDLVRRWTASLAELRAATFWAASAERFDLNERIARACFELGWRGLFKSYSWFSELEDVLPSTPPLQAVLVTHALLQGDVARVQELASETRVEDMDDYRHAILSSYGFAYFAVGELDRALEIHELALEAGSTSALISANILSPFGAIITRTSLGLDAAELARSVLDRSITLGWPTGVALGLYLDAFASQSKPVNAIEKYELALRVAQDTGIEQVVGWSVRELWILKALQQVGLAELATDAIATLQYYWDRVDFLNTNSALNVLLILFERSGDDELAALLFGHLGDMTGLSRTPNEVDQKRDAIERLRTRLGSDDFALLEIQGSNMTAHEIHTATISKLRQCLQAPDSTNDRL